MPLSRPAAGGESCFAGFFLVFGDSRAGEKISAAGPISQLL
ncbi:hypothetical protein CLOM621_07840 [Clostridium sp. M62/1]|nr:hypothetical protein CLOM621_07840 [Clostridium sp. M62/1]CBK78110.1 hypothetical protein CLS_27710 [[Clostridium] cf. saccharolyticum K10]